MIATPDRSPVAELPPILPPIVCTSWCEHGDGHPGMRHAEDQRCETEEARTYLHNRKDNDAADYVTTYIEGNGRRRRRPFISASTLTPVSRSRQPRRGDSGAACSRWQGWRGCPNPRPWWPGAWS
jgi:hypothetical protein